MSQDILFKIYKKYLIGIIIIAILSSSFLFWPARRVQAQWAVVEVGPNLAANTVTSAMTTGQKIKDFILDTLAWTFANIAIDQMTKQTVNWINSGFQGNPFFVTNPGDFLKDAADQASGVFFEQMGLDFLCAPFRTRIELALKSQMPFQRRMQCTITDVVENIEAFENDFLAGGWAGWIAMTSQPQNNIYGAYLGAMDELERRKQEARQQAQNEVDQGQGFMSWKECKGFHEKYKPCLAQCTDCNTGSEAEQAKKKAAWEKQCEKWYCERWETETPGKAIGDRLNNALGADFGRLQVADEINEILGALINQFISSALRHLSSGAAGERGCRPACRANEECIDGQCLSKGNTPPESLKNSVREMINGAINQENIYRQSKQDSLDTIGDIKTSLDNLANCLGTGIDPRKADYESKETDIEGDIRDSTALILEATEKLLNNIDASTYEELQEITDDFINVIEPKMHSPYEIGAAAEEYGKLKDELEQINTEYQQCLESKESTSSTP